MNVSIEAATIAALGGIIVALIAFVSKWVSDYLARLRLVEGRVSILETLNAQLREEKLALREAKAEAERKLQEALDEIEDLKAKVDELQRHVAQLEARSP